MEETKEWHLAPSVFLSLRAYLHICRCRDEDRNFSKSQSPYKGGEFGVFPSPRDYMKAVLRIFPSPKTHIDMGVPNPIYWHISSYFPDISSYFWLIPSYFLHILTYFNTLGPDLEILPSPPDIFSNGHFPVTSSEGVEGVYSQILISPSGA